MIPALYELAEELIGKDEKMLIVTSAYGYFQHTAEYNRIELVCSELKSQQGYFTIDFNDFEKKAADPKMKLVLWCTPTIPPGVCGQRRSFPGSQKLQHGRADVFQYYHSG